MKFKVGDKVKIRSDLKKGQSFGSYVVISGMLKFKGKIAKIRKRNTDGSYGIDLGSEHWGWTKEMFEPVGKFFKSLPNNYTGTIEVENGYIVEKEILDEEEKEYLSAVIRPFKDRVDGVGKRTDRLKDKYEYICIVMNRTADIFYLPSFKESTMYKGMVVDKNYTLKELGLDE